MWWTLLSLAHAADCAVIDGEQLRVASPFAFASRTAELADPAPVAEVHCALSAEPSRTVQIEVHTDSQGASSYNQRLSQQRADAIRAALLALGIGADRVTAVGYGELYPLTTNSTAEGRATNRRIELHLADPATRPVPPPIETPMPAPPPPATPCDPVRSAVAAGTPHTFTLPGHPPTLVAELAACLAPWTIDASDDRLYAYGDGWELHAAPSDRGLTLTLTRP